MPNLNDKNNEPKSRTQTIIRAVLFAMVLVTTAVALISLKQLTNDGPLTPEGLAARDSLQNIAHPDTTEAPDSAPAPAVSTPTPQGTPITAPTDSLTTTDARTPIDAGYEDGYYAGIIDGVAGEERASYDESSQFPTPAQRQSYTDAYRRGYTQGFEDGLAGKEFSVVPLDNDEKENAQPSEEKPAADKTAKDKSAKDKTAKDKPTKDKPKDKSAKDAKEK